MRIQSTTANIIGKPVDRVEGRLKVTGQAHYTAEIHIPNLAYGVLVQSTIAKGRVREINTAVAEKAPGVLAIITHKNVPRLNQLSEEFTADGKPGETRQPLQDDVVHHSGQHLAVVVADTLEQATYAAELVKVIYDEQEPLIQLEQALATATEPPLFSGQEELQVCRQDVAGALATADLKIEQTYTTPVEHHNPIEPSATIAVWKGDELTLYDTTRWIKGVQKAVSQTLGIPLEKIRVICKFIGGAFGSKGYIWGHVILTALAAKQVGRPVKLVLTRQQMFTSAGHRPRTVQSLALGATKDGKLTALRHTTITQTSPFAEFIEPSGRTSKILYACPNLEITHKLVRINTPTPTFMRAPGESSGTFALESAMDELAYALQLDPIELRLINHADVNPQDRKPWSSKYLKKCYQQGMERFGRHKRNPQPRSMKNGDLLVGWGMASATYPGYRMPASAKATIFASGQAVVSSATHDVGSGTYTSMTQLAADALGLPLEKVKFELGDSQFSPAPVTGGSWTAASVGSAVVAAAEAAKMKLIRIALADPASPLCGAAEDRIAVSNGWLFLKAEPSTGETIAEILSRTRTPAIEAEVNVKPGDEREKFSFHSFGAHFVEVQVDALLGQVQIRRFVSVFDAGRILNPKTVRSQLIGGIVFGIGMALLEHTVSDLRTGRIINANLGEYHVPVNADVLDIDISFIGQPDPYINPMGARGIGEIGIVGTAAAIANAIYHATGKRIRDLPITLDKLL